MRFDLEIVAKLIIIIGFCTGTVGAAGMSAPPEGAAPWLLGLGVVGIFVGGIWGRLLGRKAVGEGGDHVENREKLCRQLEAIRDIVVDLDEKKAELTRDELTQRIDQMMKNEYFDLTSRHEELMKLLGFAEYARIWEKVATAERLLNRVWSIATDGHLEEALEELPTARRQLELACEAVG